MDKWKIGEDEFFKEGYDKNGFSIGEKNGDNNASDANTDLNNSKANKNDRGSKRRKGSKANKNDLKKIFYVMLGIAAFLSAYYLLIVLFPGNNTNVEIFGLKTKVYRPATLPENDLLITGYIVNKNKFSISYVKLNGKLYSTKNIVLLTKHVYAGNLIKFKKLKNMSNIAVNMTLGNKEGVNMSNVEILPNHPIKFMLVFLNISPNSKNYSITISHFYRIKK
ncbi:MAG TPA: hypothetical protein ENI54_01775 [bacterium]|nr:hypothetical protein [bacterium]